MSRRHPVAAIALVAFSLALVPACSGDLGALDPEADESSDIAVLWWGMLAAGTAVLALVVVLFAWAARGRRPGDEVSGTGHRRSSRLVLLGGIALPVVVLVPLAIGMLVVAARVSSREGPADLEVHVTGHQYWWEVTYPESGVVTANEIHLPAGESVRFRLETDDVIHSFWFPQLSGKIDMIPGEVTELRFTPRAEGEHVGICAEFCGLQHARMRMLAIVQPREEFDAWLAAQAEPARPPQSEAAQRGQEVFDTVGCSSCHTVRGTDAGGDVGPDLTHLASRRTLAALTIPNGRGQLGGWVTDPQSVKPGNLMPPSPLGAQQLLDLLDYLEGLE